MHGTTEPPIPSHLVSKSIDPIPAIPPRHQVDFHGGGSLVVAGADADAARIGAFIHAELDRITAIYVTLDTHQVGGVD